MVFTRAGDAVVGRVARGDLLVFMPPHRPREVWLKRLIGLPGDTVEIRDGVLRVNGRLVREPYVAAANATMPYSRAFAPARVPPGHVVLLGRNLDNSEDSRFRGFATLTSVRGRVTD